MPELDLKKWQKIHPEFTWKLIDEWKWEKGFKQGIEEWIKKGIKPSEANLASYCRYKRLDPKRKEWNIEQLREEFLKTDWQDWTDIKNDFSGRDWINDVDKTYQQSWEELGITYIESQKWIKAGLEVNDYKWASLAKRNKFTPEQFASKFSSKISWEERDIQEWVDFFYPLNKNERSEVTELDIRFQHLTGSLELTSFDNLNKIILSNNQLTNCSFLNQLNNPHQLRELDISNNSFFPNDLSIFSPFINLEKLWIDNGDKLHYINYNPWNGSLQPLQFMNKLKNLDITSTNVDSGLEYLPESLEFFYCLGTKVGNELEIYGSHEERNLIRPLNSWRIDQQKNILEQENSKIEGLEDDIIRLTNLTNEQRKKIVNAYLKFAPQKELLKELIDLQLEFTRFKRTQGYLDDYDEKLSDYERKIWELSNKLRKSVSKEEMNEIRNILDDCEVLVQWELELESEIIKRKLLLNEAYQKVISLTVNINKEINAEQGNIYIANIIKNHDNLNKYDFQQEKLSDLLNQKNQLTENLLLSYNNIYAEVWTKEGHIFVGSEVNSQVVANQVNQSIITRGNTNIGGNFSPQQEYINRIEQSTNNLKI